MDSSELVKKVKKEITQEKMKREKGESKTKKQEKDSNLVVDFQKIKGMITLTITYQISKFLS